MRKPGQTLLFLTVGSFAVFAHTLQAGEVDQLVRVLVSQRCFDCHQGTEAEAGLDLESLLKVTESVAADELIPQEVAANWKKVQKAISRNLMPPEKKLQTKDRERFQSWFHTRIVLKDGQPHIGPTPLRRLTHYEFLNSLEDLLGVSVRAEYNILSSVNVEKGFVEKVLPVEVPGESGFVNDAHALADQPLPLLEYLKCIDFALSKINGNPSSLEMLFGFREVPDRLSPAQIETIAREFLHRALRGRSTPQQVARAVSSYQHAVKTHEPLPALKAMLRTILLMPEFSYRLETSRGQTTPYPVSNFELATRLSYFLTGSTPDKQLLAAAKAETLTDPQIREQHITRLLNHPRRISLSERFAAQWIGFEELVSDAGFDERGVPTINRAQYDELLYFFDELIRSNRSVLDVVDSDWAYISKYNSRTYGSGQFQRHKGLKPIYTDILESRRLTGTQRRGIENIYDPPTLQKVTGERYGGVITSTAVLRLTSAPERTSPVRRGVWLLDTIVGEKLEAPKNVPPIENAARSLPLKNPGKLDLIKAHTEMASCMMCHKDIDPIGFGLENFDPVGRWRTQYRDKRPVISEGVLPGGKTFSSPKELKRQLLELYKEQIVRNWITRLLSYAIGRALQPYDQITVDHIYQRLVDSEYRTGVLIREIINSPQFLCRQDRTE